MNAMDFVDCYLMLLISPVPFYLPLFSSCLSFPVLRGPMWMKNQHVGIHVTRSRTSTVWEIMIFQGVHRLCICMGHREFTLPRRFV